MDRIVRSTPKLLIAFCNTGHIVITSDNIEDIIDAAASMEFVQLEKGCCQHLISNLEVDNCMDALLLADKYNLAKLNQESLKFTRSLRGYPN